MDQPQTTCPRILRHSRSKSNSTSSAAGAGAGRGSAAVGAPHSSQKLLPATWPQLSQNDPTGAVVAAPSQRRACSSRSSRTYEGHNVSFPHPILVYNYSIPMTTESGSTQGQSSPRSLARAVRSSASCASSLAQGESVIRCPSPLSVLKDT